MPYYPDMLFALFAIALLTVAVAGCRLPRLRRVCIICRDYGFLIAVMFFFQQGVARACVIPTGSMLPTIQLQDRLMVDILGVKLQGVHRGDVVVLRSPENNVYLCKRVVGLGGDVLEVRDGQLWRNVQPVREAYLAEPMQGEFGPYTVPAQRVFVMGDNRNDSHDSRSFGSIPLADVLGRASLVFWPLSRAGSPLQ